MKIRFLLFFLLFTSLFLEAQQPYKNLIFSEVRMDQNHHAYVELCNMGDVSVDLSQFEVGSISPWSIAPWDTIVDHGTFSRGENSYVRLPARMLNPGETFVIANVKDWAREMELINPEKYGAATKNDTWRLVDLEVNLSESPDGDPRDSISPWDAALACWSGSYCFYLCHHYTDKDSLFTDAVNAVFTNEGKRPDNYGASDVAGEPDATVNDILVRKFSVKKGTIDWEQARGIDITDSEWLPVPILVAGGWEAGRKEFWTLGNHGDFRLNSDNLKSKTIAIDWAKKTMTVDWGARNQDSIMNEFDFAKGIAWKYHQSANKLDSAYTSVRLGDSLTLYGCGNQLDVVKFALIPVAPKSSEARVIPKNQKGSNGSWFTPYEVSENESGIDSISNVAFDTRVDTLFKYLEKPEAASWKIVWVDGVARPDLIDGDILRVTAENGSTVKDYTIQVEKYRPSHDATLSSISWPDIPEKYKGIYGWKGDTIPNFSPTKYNYTVEVPYDVDGVPGLVAKATDPETKIEVVRATSLFGSDAAKTVKINTVAEDDTTLLTYSVRLEKEKDLVNVQPYAAEPFISEIVFRAGWRQFFIEIANPGNQDLDLSHYCLVRSYNTNPAQAITTSSTKDDFATRFQRYVPGYVWEDEANWTIQPGILKLDLSVNPIVKGGDVFVIAWAFPNDKDATSYQYSAYNEIDVNFKNGQNPWGIEFEEFELYANGHLTGGWYNSDYVLYKILNDSVLNGTKPLVDPYDVEVIDVVGRCNGQVWGNVSTTDATFDQNGGIKRLPQYYKGNPDPAGSFLDTVNSKPSEWFYHNEAYWTSEGYNYPNNRGMICSDIGSQEIDPVTEFISTVASGSYTVSKGYSLNETIGGGVQEGITIAEFMKRIITIDGQTLTFTSDGTVLTDTDVLKNGTVLTVVSRNKDNTTKYTISVSEKGLDNNALLTSTKYTIAVNGSAGTIKGFEAGTKLQEVFNNVTPPANASLFGAYNEDGSYAPFTQMKYDTSYVDVIATDKIFFEVIAQDGETRIEYQLVPNSKTTDAYVLSNVYDINQTALKIALIPDGTSVEALYSFLSPAPGATIELLNIFGQPRAMGTIYEDDKLVVTAADGVTKKTYSLELYSDYAALFEANITSDIYPINQSTYRINGIAAGTTVADFIKNISISEGATYVILDKKNVAKTTNIMEANDQIVVTSKNGIIVHTYKVSVKLGLGSVANNKSISAYPNPTTGIINIDGLKKGNVIQVFNASGRNMMTIKAESSKQVVSLNNLINGLYLINVTNENQQISRFKVIKK